MYEKRRHEKGRLYSLWNKGHLFYIQELERGLIGLLSEHGLTSLEGKQILEVGCGSGRWIRKFLELGANPDNLVGIDILDWRIDAARRTCPENVRLECSNAEQLEFSDESFDVIAQFTVFSSILDSNIRKKVASECCVCSRRTVLSSGMTSSCKILGIKMSGPLEGGRYASYSQGVRLSFEGLI